MRARLPDRDGTVDRDGVRIHYEVYGEGAETMFFVPPWSIVHSRVYKAQIPYFGERFRCVAYDPRGNGRSDHPRGMAWLRCETIRNAGSAVPFLQWRDPDLDASAITDTDARELTVQPSVRTDRFPDFRRAVAELALKPPARVDPRPQQGALSVFVNSDLLDRDLGTGVAQWLETRGFMVLEPPQATQDAREEWEASVKYCDSLLLVYGQTKPAWVRTQILLSNKVQRETPLDLLSVCVGPPLPQQQSREKLDALALRYSGIYYMQVDDTKQLNALELEKFASRLREAHVHG